MENIMTFVYLEAISPDQQLVVFVFASRFSTISIYPYRRWCIKGQTLLSYVTTKWFCYFRVLLLRVSSAPAHCAYSPDRSGIPRLPTRYEGGFLDRLQCCWTYYTQHLLYL